MTHNNCISCEVCHAIINNKVCKISKDNLILDNKKCYQIITQDKINQITIRLPKKMFKLYKTNGLVYTNNSLRELAKQNFFGDCNLYKFNIEKMIQTGYGVYKERR